VSAAYALVIDHLDIAYRIGRADRTVVRDLSIQIARGEA
jgi:ABC-type dipeptide/oligopeptide/nickel transport system ATPase subunit